MKQSHKLYVFFERVKVGEFVRDSEYVYSFTYSEEWLNFPERFQLALVMPLQKEPFGHRITLSFFENLLAEGETREILEKKFHLESPFEFLKKFGKDCAGAITISVNEEFHLKKPSKIKIEMNDVFMAISKKENIAELITNTEYLSLAGAQDKFPAIYEDGNFYLPQNGLPTSHIVKVPISRSGVKESVFNEYYCMKLAKAVGFNIPHCFIWGDEIPLFIIERYDRFKDKNGEYHRIHQQDFCQAQGILSEHKYEEKGGPSIENNFSLIKENVWANKRIENAFSFLDWLCFNILIGNNDTHSKNLSFLLKNNKIELAPFYDILCTAIYPKLKKQFAFKVGGRDEASRIGKNQLEILDRQLNLKRGTLTGRMVLMRDKIREHKSKVAKEVMNQFPKVKTVTQIADLIESRCRGLTRQGIS